MAHVRRDAANSRPGATTVEVALLLPLLMMLTLGTIEYGWAFLKTQQITEAARRGARYAAMPAVTANTQVTDASDGSASPPVSILRQHGIPVTAGTVTVPTGVNVPTGHLVTVNVSISYPDVRLLGFPLLPMPSTLTASCSMAKEGP